MISVQPATATEVPPPTQPKKKSKLLPGILLLLIIVGGLLWAVCHLGSSKVHQEKKHLLYQSFDASSTHKKLLANLEKTKLSLLVGKKADGVLNFVEHYANKNLLKGRTVYIETYTAGQHEIFQFAKGLNTKILSTFGQLKHDSDWIVISQTGEIIPQEKITKIQTYYHSSKILVVTPSKHQKLKGFKTFQFGRLDGKLLGKTIASSFKIKPKTAEILSDWHGSHGELFEGLAIQKFDEKEYLGEEHIAFSNISSEGTKLLQKLCKEGQIKSKIKIKNPLLEQYGVIYARGIPLWQNHKSLLNYELNFGVNCKNHVASEADLKEHKEWRQKWEQQQIAKAQEERKKEEERKLAEQKKIEEEIKRQEELKKAEEVKKAQEEATKAAKASKTAGSKKTGKKGK